jgi:GMP synthase (glutamine-hydrolysing)
VTPAVQQFGYGGRWLVRWRPIWSAAAPIRRRKWERSMLRTMIAIRHIHFEDLGTFGSVLTDAGYGVQYCDAGVHDLGTLDPMKPDLVVVLGGPVGVYETDAYPFLAEERAFLKVRLAAKRPTFGICLGAQQVAAALGANVAPSGIKEIGFSAISLTEAGHDTPLRHLAGVPVLHWHGDSFAIPEGAKRLAETGLCRNQAFALGTNVLGVQFHPEADARGGLERWLIGHAVELAAAGIDPRILREDAARVGPSLREAARSTLAEWLDRLTP